METSPSLNRSFPSLRTSDKVVKAKGALDALVTNADIVAAMAPRHYTEGEKVKEGRALLQAVRDEMEDQDEEIGDKLSATAGQNDGLADVQAGYKPFAETARVVFEDEEDVLTALGLRGEHKKSYAARLERMRQFVAEARKPARLARIESETEYTAKDLDALEAAIDAGEAGLTTQDEHEALAEQSTDERTVAVKALDKWMLTMQGHARVRLRGKRQLLEMLGVPRR